MSNAHAVLALLQVILCGEEIGWRDEARHLIIFLTDDSYHFAGDGILAGLWKPYNDKGCSLVDGIFRFEIFWNRCIPILS